MQGEKIQLCFNFPILPPRFNDERKGKERKLHGLSSFPHSVMIIINFFFFLLLRSPLLGLSRQAAQRWNVIDCARGTSRKCWRPFRESARDIHISQWDLPQGSGELYLGNGIGRLLLRTAGEFPQSTNAWHFSMLSITYTKANGAVAVRLCLPSFMNNWIYRSFSSFTFTARRLLSFVLLLLPEHSALRPTEGDARRHSLILARMPEEIGSQVAARRLFT